MNRQGPIPEQLEYEELAKKMRLVTTKLRIAQEGISVSALSQQKLDRIIRIFDDMDQIQRDTQQKTSKIQQDTNIEVQKVNQDAGKKFADMQKKYQDLIKSLKENNPQVQQIEEQVQAEPVKEEIAQEEIREKTHEERVNEITDIVLKAMRDSVSQKVDEILKIVDSKTEFTIGRGVKLPQEDIEKLHEDARQMTIESALLPVDKPNDKDIPVITLQKTETSNFLNEIKIRY